MPNSRKTFQDSTVVCSMVVTTAEVKIRCGEST